MSKAEEEKKPAGPYAAMQRILEKKPTPSPEKKGEKTQGSESPSRAGRRAR